MLVSQCVSQWNQPPCTHYQKSTFKTAFYTEPGRREEKDQEDFTLAVHPSKVCTTKMPLVLRHGMEM